MERRAYPRFGVRLPVSLSSDKAGGDGHVLNISMGGCAVESEIEIKVGAFLRLAVTLSDEGDTKPVKADLAAVRWCKDRKFGMEFLSMPSEAQQRLYRFVGSLKAGGDPASRQQ